MNVDSQELQDIIKSSQMAHSENLALFGSLPFNDSIRFKRMCNKIIEYFYQNSLAASVCSIQPTSLPATLVHFLYADEDYQSSEAFQVRYKGILAKAYRILFPENIRLALRDGNMSDDDIGLEIAKVLVNFYDSTIIDFFVNNIKKTTVWRSTLENDTALNSELLHIRNTMSVHEVMKPNVVLASTTLKDTLGDSLSSSMKIIYTPLLLDNTLLLLTVSSTKASVVLCPYMFLTEFPTDKDYLMTRFGLTVTDSNLYPIYEIRVNK